MKAIRLLFLFIILNSYFIITNAAITIDSIHVSVSTCPNNGTAGIVAHSTSDTAVFLYNIVSGPELYPLQNDSVFHSLYPGNYTVRVHDINSYDSATTTFTITGTYKTLASTPVVVAPLCITGAQGTIIADPAGTGSGPYTWQVISPFAGTAQGNDTLRNLAPGVYVVKITDACSNAVTAGAVIDSGKSGFSVSAEDAFFIGCDTIALHIQFSLNIAFANIPLKYTYTTSSGTIVRYRVPTPTVFKGIYLMIDTLTGIGFGGYLKTCVTDTCQNTYCLYWNTLALFQFDASFTTGGSGCAAGESAKVSFSDVGGPAVMYTDPNTLPLTFTLTDVAADTVVYSITHTCCPTLPAQTPGKTYLLTVTDRCGDVYQQTVPWMAAPAANFSAQSDPLGGCVDSTGIGDFAWSGFGSALTLKFLSGPSRAYSTKHRFAYSDTIIYPVVISNLSNTGSMILNDMPPGTYTYQVYDSCGNNFTGSFVINYVSSLAANYAITTSCAGLNTVTAALGNGLTSYKLTLTKPGDTLFNAGNQATHALVFSDVPYGRYITQLTFQIYHGGMGRVMPGVQGCWSGTDTLNVVPINDSILSATDVATCNGTIYIRLDADSSNGKLPFKYEVISGPETYSPQTSNLFTVNSYGIYTVGVIDSCGNVDARQISIDTGKFTPVVRSGGWCVGSRVQLSETASPFYTYRWTKPNSTIFIGDTLVIDPLTTADTGLYLITKTVNINGCTDSALGSYYLVIRDTFQQSVSLCVGDTLFVGPYIHTAGGLYSDTLSGSYGCDSVIVTTLSLHSGHVAITPSAPPVCHTGPTHLTASGATSYLWSPGNQTTDTITVSPLVKTVYAVLADENLACSASASVAVYPSTDSIIIVTSDKAIFCADDSAKLCAPLGFNTYRWSGGIESTGDCVFVKQAGDYYVIASDTDGCTASSNHLSVAVYPVPSVAITVQGDTLISYGQVNYQWLFNDHIIPGATEQLYVAHEYGSYSVEVTDTNGCTTISNPVMLTGISDLHEDYISIYSNPNSAGTWQLAVGNDLLGSALEVYNEQGQIVLQSKISLLKSKIDLDVASGIYYLRISNNNSTVVRKLVKL